MTTNASDTGLPELFGWSPPADWLAVEQAVIGAMIQSRKITDMVADVLAPEDFIRPAHAVIFQAAVELSEDGQEIDPTAVLSSLTKRGDLMKVGGGVYLHELVANSGVGIAGTMGAVRRVEAIAMVRRGFEATDRARQILASADFDPTGDPDRVRQLFEHLGRRSSASTDISVGALLPPVIDALSEDRPEPEIMFGYRDIDEFVAIRPGQVIVLGARPSVGKTTIGMDIARFNAVRRGKPVLAISMEMSHDEVMHRLLAAESRVPLDRFQHHCLTEDDWRRIAEVKPRVDAAPLHVDDESNVALSHVRARIRGLDRIGQRPKLIVIDYLQLMKLGQRSENRQVEVSEISRNMKLLARETNIPIMVLAQVNRESEKRTDKKPTSSDLRESGAIEANADIVLLLHSPSNGEPEHPQTGRLEVIVDKNRQGRKGTVELAFQGHYGRATDLTHDIPPVSYDRHLNAVADI